MSEEDFTIIPLPFWFVLFATILFGCTGCATNEEEVWHRVCYEQFLGKDERGLFVVRHFCIKEQE